MPPKTEESGIGVIGCNGTTNVQEIVAAKQNTVDDKGRVVFTAPGIKNLAGEDLTGAYTAAAVAGLIASLPVQSSLLIKF